jgi:uncharacterized membrane protein
MKITGIGHPLMALGMIALGVMGLIYRDLSPAIVPASMHVAVALVVAVLVLASGAGLFVPRLRAGAALVLSTVFLLIVIVSRIPKLDPNPIDPGAWQGIGETSSIVAGCIGLFGLFTVGRGRGLTGIMAGERGEKVAVVLFGLTLLIHGWSHFAYAKYTATLIPDLFPAHLTLAYATGVFHAAAGVAILSGVLPRLAATLEAVMMTAFGLIVWPPMLLKKPDSHDLWSELVITAIVAAAAWVVAYALRNQPWIGVSGPRYLARSLETSVAA